MPRGVRSYLVAPLVALSLVGCRFGLEEREPWRAEAEEKCIAERLVEPSEAMEPGSAVNGNGTCGMTKPFKVAAVNGGFVEFKPKATLSCPLIANVDVWFHESIQPAAMAWYGSPIVEIKQISAYSCRTMNGQPGAAISEHAFGNALDIAAFRFADGREVEFKKGWKGRPEEQGFLRAVHAAACERFSTVLAPGADMFHYDHIHVDLARRASGRAICKPAPMTMPAPRQPLPESVPVARGPAQRAPVYAQNQKESYDPYALQRGNRAAQPPMAAAPQRDSTSPWAHSVPQAMRPTIAQGPTVIQREPMRAAGAPLPVGNHSLGHQAPPPNSFGTPVPIAQRVRDQLGFQQQAAPAQGQYMQAAPVQAPRMPAPPPPQPGYQQNPYGLTPPGRIPNARLDADPTVTGSIPKETKSKSETKKGVTSAPTSSASLMSPQSMAEQAPSSEPASVFNLLPAPR
jgi:hypothetical protein